jgi:four helix bundle protein
LEERLIGFAVRVIRLVDTFESSRGGAAIGNQLVRSGTSPALNHGEVQAAESRADFIHKIRICLKELRESRRALRIAAQVPLTAEAGELSSLIDESEQLIRIFVQSVRTAQTNGVENSARVRETGDVMADDWTLDVERWTLDVFASSSKTGEAL